MAKDKHNTTHLRQKLWPVADEAVGHIMEASRFGFVKKRKPELTETEKEQGYMLVEVDNSLKYDEMVIKSLGLSTEGPDAYLSHLASLTFQELVEMIVGDGITPTINNLDELKHYLLNGADYSAIPLDDPQQKKRDSVSA